MPTQFSLLGMQASCPRSRCSQLNHRCSVPQMALRLLPEIQGRLAQSRSRCTREESPVPFHLSEPLLPLGT